jgi:hypothetical protein
MVQIRKSIVTRGNTIQNRQGNGAKGKRNAVQREKVGGKVDSMETGSTATEEETRIGSDIEQEDEGEKLGDMLENRSKSQHDSSTLGPKDMEIELRKNGSTEGEDGKSVSTLTVCPNVAKDGNLTVVQRSNLLNWAEEHFFPGSKIMTFDEAKTNETLRKGICRALGINDVGWAIVGTEAIKKLRSAMSDRLSLNRKVVKGLYIGKKCCFLLVLWTSC